MSDYSPIYSPFSPSLFGTLVPFIVIVAIWTLVIKGYALWHAARNNQSYWFIALLVINTLGILELIYLIWFRKPVHTPPAPTSSAQA